MTKRYGLLPLMYSAPMELIRIETNLLEPTDWDQGVIQDELEHYVQLAREGGGIPEVMQRGTDLLLVSGEPFVRAARAASPAILRMICQSRRRISIPGVRQVAPKKPGESEEKLAADEPKLGIVYFANALSNTEAKLATDALESSLLRADNLVKSEITAGIFKGKTILRWQMSLPFNRQKAEMLKRTIAFEIHSHYPMRSWNGIRISVMQQAVEQGFSER